MLRLRSCASSMMRLVVLAQLAVALGLGEQDAVGHELDGRFACRFLEAHLVADAVAELRCRAPRRCAPRPSARRCGAAAYGHARAAHLQQHLRQLGGLAGAGLAADDHYAMRRDGGAISSRRALIGSADRNQYSAGTSATPWSESLIATSVPAASGRATSRSTTKMADGGFTCIPCGCRDTQPS